MSESSTHMSRAVIAEATRILSSQPKGHVSVGPVSIGWIKQLLGTIAEEFTTDHEFIAAQSGIQAKLERVHPEGNPSRIDITEKRQILKMALAAMFLYQTQHQIKPISVQQTTGHAGGLPTQEVPITL